MQLFLLVKLRFLSKNAYLYYIFIYFSHFFAIISACSFCLLLTQCRNILLFAFSLILFDAVEWACNKTIVFLPDNIENMVCKHNIL